MIGFNDRAGFPMKNVVVSLRIELLEAVSEGQARKRDIDFANWPGKM